MRLMTRVSFYFLNPTKSGVIISLHKGELGLEVFYILDFLLELPERFSSSLLFYS